MWDSVGWILSALVFPLFCQKTQAAPSSASALVGEDGFNGSTLNQCNRTIRLRDPGKGADEVLWYAAPLWLCVSSEVGVTLNQP